VFVRDENSISATRCYALASATRSDWNCGVAAIMQRTVGVIVGFCTIGLLLTVAFLHSVPNFGEILASLDSMP
jgi:hypothetical protein